MTSFQDHRGQRPHIGIIGGGPAGYVAALRAAALGARVTLAEAAGLGGTCLHRGCIPTKRLATTGHLLDRLRDAARYGIALEGAATPRWPEMAAGISRLTGGLAKGIHGLFGDRGIELIPARARPERERGPALRFDDGRRIRVDHLLLCTGSRPHVPGGIPLDGDRVCTSDEVLGWRDLPASLLIVGGGVIACEFAFIFAALGVEVTLAGRAGTPLPGLDPDVSRLIARELKRRRIRFLGGRGIDRVEEEGGTLRACHGETELGRAERILVCTGRVPNTGDLLPGLGLEPGPRGEIAVDSWMRTAVPGIYAAGDVTGGAMLAHAASAQARVAVEHMLRGGGRTYTADHVPLAVFTQPEVGCVGLTEPEARARGGAVACSRFELRTLGRAQAMGETSGFVKLVADRRTRTLLGAHIVGPCASELVHEAAVVLRRGGSVEELAGTVHAHPTLSEGIQEAAEDLFGQADHTPLRHDLEVDHVPAP
ncbi:dihydrolipoyl dehydrogenase [Thioalbus denitrificans]|uniref:Dihydrolipoyl dehydrogenase n=1 Tax=Thioalbus denitrificans TaxID=547122 RepID=A0A369C904_9GAMM|nr:dihydrolipoyl dehydrogenase [Thioalbus denitrificans]RCX30213.1 dihydrolipoamide dehydrogenase [Thioalbus denitrificans]